MPITDKDLLAAPSLDRLLALMRAADLSLLANERALGKLPTFGGEAPVDTRGVWSWDQDRLLVGAGQSDLQITARKDWEERSHR